MVHLLYITEEEIFPEGKSRKALDVVRVFWRHLGLSERTTSYGGDRNMVHYLKNVLGVCPEEEIPFERASEVCEKMNDVLEMLRDHVEMRAGIRARRVSICKEASRVKGELLGLIGSHPKVATMWCPEFKWRVPLIVNDLFSYGPACREAEKLLRHMSVGDFVRSQLEMLNEPKAIELYRKLIECQTENEKAQQPLHVSVSWVSGWMYVELGDDGESSEWACVMEESDQTLKEWVRWG